MESRLASIISGFNIEVDFIVETMLADKRDNFKNITNRDIVLISHINDIKFYQIVTPDTTVKTLINHEVCSCVVFTIGNMQIKNKDISELVTQYIKQGNIQYCVDLEHALKFQKKVLKLQKSLNSITLHNK